METLLSTIARKCQWEKSVNDAMRDTCLAQIKQLEDMLPSGSGIDSGCKILIKESNAKKVKIRFSFHHMDENGSYDGWTEHVLTVTPDLAFDFDMKISGKDKNWVKDHLYEVFQHYLSLPTDSHGRLVPHKDQYQKLLENIQDYFGDLDEDGINALIPDIIPLVKRLC